jgi:hypothetical protein
MKILMAIGTLALISGFAVGDTVQENGGAPNFIALPSPLSTGLNTGVPYWNNHSGDFGGSNTANIGYFLTASGNFTGGTNYNPNGYLAATSGNPNSPASFNLVRNTNSILITLLGTFTGGVDAFGLYDASKSTIPTAAATEVPVLTTSTAVGTTVNESGISFTSYGFYVTAGGNTWFSNTALDANDGTHQHFALFNFAADANVFYLGLTDWFFGNGGNGNGDYQDLVLRINTDAAGVPEPATMALMGAGLLGLGYTRFRSRKKRPE